MLDRIRYAAVVLWGERKEPIMAESFGRIQSITLRQGVCFSGTHEFTGYARMHRNQGITLSSWAHAQNIRYGGLENA